MRASANRFTLSIVAIGISVLVLGVFIAFEASPGRTNPMTTSMDFRAFYCASRALSEHADPYRIHPATECQRDAARTFEVDATPLIPAPLPPHALLAFEPLARLPFRIASPAWFAVLFIAFVATVVLASRLANVPPIVAFITLFASDFIVSFTVGQPGPILVLSIVVLAIGLQRRSNTLIVGSSLVLSIEPHIALPIFLAVLAFDRHSRLSLFACLCAIAALDVACGVSLVSEYIFTVIPLHAISEIAAYKQFSLTSALWAAGVPISHSIEIGNASYVLTTVAALILTFRAIQRTKDSSYIALIPAACSVFAGPYIHLYQIAIALPLALMLPRGPSTIHRIVAVAAVVFLSIPALEVVPFVPLAKLVFAAPLSSAAHPYVPITIDTTDPNPIAEQVRLHETYAGLFVPGTAARWWLVPHIWTWLGLACAIFGAYLIQARATGRLRRPELPPKTAIVSQHASS